MASLDEDDIDLDAELDEWLAKQAAEEGVEFDDPYANEVELITPQRFYPSGQVARGDRHLYASRTRFIPDHILGHFECASWPPPSAAPGRAPRPEIRVDLKSRMRGMWR